MATIKTCDNCGKKVIEMWGMVTIRTVRKSKRGAFYVYGKEASRELCISCLHKVDVDTGLIRSAETDHV